MKKMAASNVLIVGMKGLGVEIGELSEKTLLGLELMGSQEHSLGRCQIGDDIRP
jgi:hypothetical protein